MCYIYTTRKFVLQTESLALGFPRSQRLELESDLGILRKVESAAQDMQVTYGRLQRVAVRMQMTAGEPKHDGSRKPTIPQTTFLHKLPQCRGDLLQNLPLSGPDPPSKSSGLIQTFRGPFPTKKGHVGVSRLFRSLCVPPSFSQLCLARAMH